MLKSVMKNNRGQFYLIAAIVIITVILGFAGITNYSKKDRYEDINHLKDELQIETEKIVEYGVNTQALIGRTTKISELIEDTARIYANYTEIENEYFIVGDQTRVIISAYLKSSPGKIGVDGNYTLFQPSLDEYEFIYYTPTLNEVTQETKVLLEISNVPYEFKLKSGINLYFIISKEGYVATNKDV